MSAGRLDITPFMREALVPHWESSDAVAQGALEMNVEWPGVWTGKDPAFSLFGIPPAFFTESWQVDSWFYHWGGLEMMRDAYLQYSDGKYYVPGTTFWPAEAFHSVDKPINGPADFDGVKVRTPMGIVADTLSAMGASPIVLPGGEVYSALDKGVIDATELFSPSANYALGFHEVSQYVVWPSPHMPFATIYFGANTDAWNALPDDLKLILEASIREFSWTHAHANYLMDFSAIEKMVEYGNTHIVFTDEEWAKFRDISMEVADEYGAASPLAAQVLASLKSFMKEVWLLD